MGDIIWTPYMDNVYQTNIDAVAIYRHMAIDIWLLIYWIYGIPGQVYQWRRFLQDGDFCGSGNFFPNNYLAFRVWKLRDVEIGRSIKSPSWNWKFLVFMVFVKHIPKTPFFRTAEISDKIWPPQWSFQTARRTSSHFKAKEFRNLQAFELWNRPI